MKMNYSIIKSFLLIVFVISAMNVRSAVSIGGFFYEFEGREASLVGCSHDGNIVIPERVVFNGDVYTVTSIGYNAFYCHHGATSVRIPNTVKVIRNQAFIYADALNSVYIPNSVTTIEGYAFYGNHNLTSIYCMASTPPNISEQGIDGLEEGQVTLYVLNESLEAYKTAPYWDRFRNTLPINAHDFMVDGIYYRNMGNRTAFVVNKDRDFNTYSGNVIIPDSINYNGVVYEVSGIEESAFLYCSNLTSLCIPVTIKTIENGAFNGCAIPVLFITGSGEWTAGALGINVEELFIESGITSIAGMKIDASSIYCFAADPPICDENTFTSYDSKLHVPPTSFSWYFTAPYWENFADVVGDANFVELNSIKLSQDYATIKIDEQFKLETTLNPTNPSYNGISWTSSNEDVAVVNDGIITALSIGECDIIASCQSIKDTCHVKVVGDIRFNLHTAKVLPNHMITLNPIIKPASANIIITSSNPSIAAARIANDKIQIAGISEGYATITITSSEDYDLPDTCFVTVFTELGDVNCDGYVNISDVTTLIDHLLGSDTGIFKAANADTNLDNNVSIADATMLIDHLLGSVDINAAANETFNVNGIEFKMISVEGGTFIMGGTPEQAGEALSDEYPTHEVKLSTFAIGETEVTQALWQAVMGNNPSDHTGDPNCPVDNVSWNDCQAFISNLNNITGKHFRLPTEAEWEFAARGGNACNGYKYSGGNTIDNIAWYRNNSDNATHAVGKMTPNELGIYDMSGNVWEWVQDWYGSYSSEAQTNPSGVITGTDRVRRGGSYLVPESNYLRVSRRFLEAPNHRLNDIGLRLAL